MILQHFGSKGLFHIILKIILCHVLLPGPEQGTALWWLQLDPMEDEGPFSISATLGSYSPVTLTDVLFGDVWICSGQSNMQFTTNMVKLIFITQSASLLVTLSSVPCVLHTYTAFKRS